MSAPQLPTPGLPWYRHFWPWFIVVLLGTTVVAGISTVVIAFANQDSLVRDDWYREGKAINRRFERDLMAEQLGLGASLEIEGRAISLALSGQVPVALDTLRLQLSHPTHAGRDREITLRRDAAGGGFRGTAETPIEGRWYATLRPLDASGEAGGWQLSETLRLPSAEPIELVPRRAAPGP